jgi:hypothetical protein
LRTLLLEYLRLLGHEVPPCEGALKLDETPEPCEWAERFLKADDRPVKDGFGDRRRCRCAGCPRWKNPAASCISTCRRGASR